MITEQTLQNWVTAYIRPEVSGKDRHTVFQELENLERSDAKALCYKIAYGSIFKNMIDEIERIHNGEEEMIEEEK